MEIIENTISPPKCKICSEGYVCLGKTSKKYPLDRITGELAQLRLWCEQSV